MCAVDDDCTLGTCNSKGVCECDEGAGFKLVGWLTISSGRKYDDSLLGCTQHLYICCVVIVARQYGAIAFVAPNLTVIRVKTVILSSMPSCSLNFQIVSEGR